MPTGFTDKIYEGEETTLRQYALRCARGMGALITLRDDPLDAELPQQLTPHTEYYDKQIAAAKARFDELLAMSDDEREAGTKAYNAEVEARNTARIADNDALAKRYGALIAETLMWNGAPEGLKEFMLGQLTTSRDFDVLKDPLAYADTAKSCDAWFVDQLEKAERDLNYATKQRAEEIELTARRNEWLAQLHASLPPAAEVA